MALPPLYKYLDAEGAKKTLGNRSFRFSKPSEYNDLEDMTAQSFFRTTWRPRWRCCRMDLST